MVTGNVAGEGYDMTAILETNAWPRLRMSRPRAQRSAGSSGTVSLSPLHKLVPLVRGEFEYLARRVT